MPVVPVHCEAMYALPFCRKTPLKFISPLTSRAYPGEIVLIPMFPPVVNKVPIVLEFPVALNVPDTDPFVDEMLLETTFDAVKLVTNTLDNVLEVAVKLLVDTFINTALLPDAFM